MTLHPRFQPASLTPYPAPLHKESASLIKFEMEDPDFEELCHSDLQHQKKKKKFFFYETES